jgi:multiple sugar transport system ATP-binding protein
VAGFIGTPAMSLIDGELQRDDNGFAVRAGGLSLRLPHSALRSDAVSEVAIGLRPEDIVLGRGTHGARIKVVEPTGHESIVLMECGGATFCTRIGSDVPLAAELRAGQDVPFDVTLARTHVFCRQSGLRQNRDDTNVTAIKRTRDAA